MYMEKFAELLEESVIVSGLIALMCIGSVCGLAVMSRPIPDVLINIAMIVVGFFFGGKVQQANTKLAGIISRRDE
jgi:FtsH-binding integral membrane protein